ncbi:MAG: hypothetical protein CMJ62_16410 [Planctomycetaceae bacterium]|nr:hypothetical protein [Planctomycetaceae bacterium]
MAEFSTVTDLRPFRQSVENLDPVGSSRDLVVVRQGPVIGVTYDAPKLLNGNLDRGLPPFLAQVETRYLQQEFVGSGKLRSDSGRGRGRSCPC